MMVGLDQQELLLQSLGDCLALPGAVVEVGCHAGSTSLQIAALLHQRKSAKEFHVYDSFQGLPDEPGCGGLMAVNQRELLDSFAQAGLLPPAVHAGWFAETLPAELPESICFAFVDCDLYSSMKQSLPHILPRLTGCLFVHDYQHPRWGPGVQRAVHEVLGDRFRVQAGMAVHCVAADPD